MEVSLYFFKYSCFVFQERVCSYITGLCLRPSGLWFSVALWSQASWEDSIPLDSGLLSALSLRHVACSVRSPPSWPICDSCQEWASLLLPFLCVEPSLLRPQPFCREWLLGLVQAPSPFSFYLSFSPYLYFHPCLWFEGLLFQVGPGVLVWTR